MCVCVCTRAWLKLTSFCLTYSERHKIFYDKVRTSSETAGNIANVQTVIIFAEMVFSPFYVNFIDYKQQLNYHIYGQKIILEIKEWYMALQEFSSLFRRKTKFHVLFHFG